MWNNVITVLSFLMSLFSFVVLAAYRSIRLRCELLDWRYVKDTGIAQCFFHVENNSMLPISVNGISFSRGSASYPCEITVRSVHTTPQGRTWETTDLPAYFAEGQARNLLLEFHFAEDISLTPGKTIDVVIYTNRRSLRRSLCAPRQGRCFRTLIPQDI